MIELDKAICSNFESSSSREWLETNGIGGYATSSVAGVNTRRYHGLLVAATRPPLGRMVLLSKFEETLTVDGERFDLSSNQYPRTVFPDGYKYLTRFRVDPFPIWTFNVAGVEIEKAVFMVNGQNTTVIGWSVTGGKTAKDPTVQLELKPLLAFRDHHHLRHEDGEFKGRFDTEEGLITFHPDAEMPTLYLAHNAAAIEPGGVWYHNFEYAIERERGFDFSEDLFQPLGLRFDLDRPAAVIASTSPAKAGDAIAFERSETTRRKALVKAADTADSFTTQLALAADQFLVSRGTGKTVIAGYPWFSDWGRDTMIALPGLTLSTGRPEIAKSILTEFSKHISDGMLPNRFPDVGETPEYNTVDATLWFFEAIRAYAKKTNDYDYIRESLYDKLADIIDWHIRGTRYRIHVDTDGLLYAGEPGVQLTWMDAKVGDWVVTPRTGKPVEIQALWYNALSLMCDLAVRFGDAARQPKFFEMAAIARDSFNGQFWNDDEDCLYDVVDGSEKDPSIRPNQIFAVGLPHTMLGAVRSRMVVDKVEAELLTPFGLRSLSPRDSRYVPVYVGSPMTRDSAYHQGTVWAWLIGGFVDAYKRVHLDTPDIDTRVAEITAGFKAHLSAAAVGQVSEIFDGDAPHTPRGCPAQAWSVAEVLRVIK